MFLNQGITRKHLVIVVDGPQLQGPIILLLLLRHHVRRRRRGRAATTLVQVLRKQNVSIVVTHVIVTVQKIPLCVDRGSDGCGNC